MFNIWIYSLASVIAVSLVSLVGLLTLSLGRRLDKVLILLVSLSAGALIGDALFHLLPEIEESYGFTLQTSWLLVLGLLIFFVLEKYIHWTHCHVPINERHSHHLAVMNLVGDGFHNFIDGLIIAASYLVSPALGFASTLAIVFHEIPQEIGDFGVLLHAGYSKSKALGYNLLSALTAVLGTVVGLLLVNFAGALKAVILPVAAAGFIYIAVADLIPELHKETAPSKSFNQIIFIAIGLLAMYGLLFLE